MSAVTLVAPEPRTALGRLRWTLADAWVVTRRDLLHWVRNPTVVLGGPVFGIVIVLLFGYVFGSGMTVPGGGDYREFLMPGMFTQTVVFGIAITLTAVANDAARGVTDRFRSIPMARSGVVVARSFADMLYSTVEVGTLVVTGVLVGWRWHEGLGRAAAAFGLLMLLRFALIWVGIFIGLSVTPEAAGAAWAPLYPLTILANTFVTPEQMPHWLGVVAEWNPLSSTVAATRELFGNPGTATSGSWIAENAQLMAVAWPLVLIAVFLPLSVRRYQRLSV
jgi:ABC-type multidrug transport system permease subunit